MRIVWRGHRHGVVGGSDNLLGKRGQDLLALGGVEGGDAGGLGNGRALESWSQLLGKRAVHGGGGCRQHALRGCGLGAGLPEESGTHHGSHCSGWRGTGVGRGSGRLQDDMSERRTDVDDNASDEHC